MAGFFEVAAADPGRIAVIEPDRATSTYGEMASCWPIELARGLRARGLGSGDTVAIISGNRRDLLDIYAAAVEIGLFVVVVNWHLTGRRSRTSSRTPGAKALFAEDRHLGQALPAAEQASIPSRSGSSSATPRIPGPSRSRFWSRASPTWHPTTEAQGRRCSTRRARRGKPKGVRKTPTDPTEVEVTLSAGVGLHNLEPQRRSLSSSSPGPSTTPRPSPPPSARSTSADASCSWSSSTPGASWS